MRAVFTISTHRLSIFALSCALSALASCLSSPKPESWSAPPCETRISHFAGNSLSGKRVAEDAETHTPADAVTLGVDVMFLESFPSKSLHPLLHEAELHSTDSGDPIRVLPGRNGLARVAFGEEAHEFRTQLQVSAERIASKKTVLPDGVAVAAEYRGLEDAFAVEVTRSSSEFVPALVAHVPDVAGAKREVSLLRSMKLADGAALAIVVPVEAGAVMWWFEFLESDVESEEHSAKFAACMDEVRMDSDSVRDRIRPLDPRDLELRRLSRADNSLDIVRYHRPALVYLASQAGASTMESVAWLAEDELLSACVNRVIESRGDLGTNDGREQIAWRLERACYRELAIRFSREELPPEMVSVLFRRAGELGRYPGLLDDVLIESTDHKELEARLVNENRLFLEDRDPAARVRAYDWLETRAVAPAGFDPLSSKEARRAALTEDRE